LYVYVSNETPNIDVFFDNLQVTHFKGALIEETHYYPFGLTMYAISSKVNQAQGIANNRYYNSIELTVELGLNQYDAFYRTFDPQIGRFMQIDPKVEGADAWSVYTAMLNNPILYADPLGDSSVPWPFRVSEKSSNNIFAPLMYQGYASIRGANARKFYNAEVAKLAVDDKTGRVNVKEVTRTKTPEPFQSAVEQVRPIEGERTKVQDPNFKGNNAKTNAEFNEAAKTTGVLGKIFIVAGVAQSTATIATSDNPVKESVTEGAGWAGALYGGSQGATIGAAAGGPFGSAVGGFIGSAVGFFMGKRAAEEMISGQVIEKNIKNNRAIIPNWGTRPTGGL
ncbi:MAG: RHS repeat-associated core domain-containing protein, partial [Chitinophagaceae bacterium]